MANKQISVKEQALINDLISEAEAAQIVARHPRVLRKHVKDRRWPVAYSTLNGRSYMYSKSDLMALRISSSNLVSW